MNKKTETEFVSIELQDGIVVVDFLAPEIKIDAARTIVDLRLQLIAGNSYPVLVDARKVASIDKESRDYFSGEKATQGVKAGAILTSSVFSSFMGNFFLRVTYNKNKLPTKLFTDKNEAIKWLSKFK